MRKHECSAGVETQTRGNTCICGAGTKHYHVKEIKEQENSQTVQQKETNILELTAIEV